MIQQIKSIAQKNTDGFTVKLQDLSSPTSGYVVAYLETQNSHDDAGLAKCIDHALANGGYVGGWLDQNTGKYYYDSVAIVANRDEAIELGKANEQLAIFDLNEMLVIEL